MTESDFAEFLLAEDICPTAGLRVWDSSDPRRRLGIYRNNVLSSLVGALADTFPVTWQLVGAEFFRAMALQYIRISPPSTPVLTAYGSSFSRFVAQFEPARSVPYLADVAELEWARTMAYHAADVPPLPQDVVVAILAHGDAADLTVKCHPSVAVTNSRYAARSVWAAHQGEGSLAGLAIHVAESALVLRAKLDVLVVPLRADGARFIEALLQGMDIASAAVLAAHDADEFDIVEALGLLVQHEAVVSIEETPRAKV